jgi:hypothetical protein
MKSTVKRHNEEKYEIISGSINNISSWNAFSKKDISSRKAETGCRKFTNISSRDSKTNIFQKGTEFRAQKMLNK